ncbi:PAS domain S-box protein [Sphaerospermopsis aphanizomenoides BCCUSP55]|uniref:PAS domain S-box protein n=1 Tax=Sphaerospermopsis aphanizomenoides TaxID=459663 RepID=UPI00190596B6|nr:PAS domain S-box protein [Sphaerospermopsis aphanizomenoides]MBK1990824.1 PAS domain S-box protein [Sphaerospermopsis aphanizomenoides BCCUSP55]
MTYRAPVTILLIDDCAEDREVYSRYLRQDSLYTYRILNFETTTEAIEFCQQERPDIILLDFLLPDGDGLEFLEELRQNFSNSQSAIIMLTGQGDEITAVRAMKAGVQDYLVKGQLTRQILQNAIHQAVEKMHLTRQLEQIREQQQIIAAAGLRIRQSLNIEETLPAIATEVRQFLKADRVVVYQFHPDMSGTIVAESVLPGWGASLGANIQDKCFQIGAGQDYHQGKKRAIDDIYQAGLTDCHLQLLEQFAVKANLVVPIIVTGQLWGLLITHQCSAPRHWESQEIDLLDQLGVQIAIAIQQASAYQQAQVELAERQRIEKNLRESEERFRNTFEQAAVGIGHLSLDGQFLCINQRFCEITGYSQSELQTLTFHEITHLDDLFTDLDSSNMLLTGKIQTYSVEKRYIRKDRSIVWINLTVSLVRDAAGSPHYFISVIEDISRRKQAEMAIQESEARFQTFMNNSPSASWITDADGRIVYISQTFLCAVQLAANTVEDVIGKTVFDLFPREVAQQFFDNNQQVIQTQQILETIEKAPRLDGTTGNFLVYKFPLPSTTEQCLVGGVAVDITERIIAQQALQKLNQELETRVEQRTAALQESEQRWQLVVKGSNDGIWDWDLRTNQVFFSTRWKEMRGFREDEISKELEEWLSRIHPDDYERIIQALNNHFDHKTPFFQEEYRIRRKDGSYLWILDRGQALWDEAGKAIRMSGSETDITRQKEAEAELLALSRFQQAILDGSDYGIIFINYEGIIQTFNAGAEKMLGYTADEVIGQHGLRLFHNSEEIEKLAAALSLKLGQEIVGDRDYFNYVTQNGKSYEDEFTYIRKDGSRFPVFLSISALSNSEGEIIGFLGIAQDITERKGNEEKLRNLSDRLTLALQAGAIGTWEWDMLENTEWDDRMYELYGLQRSEVSLTYQDWVNVVYPDDLAEIEALLQATLRGEKPFSKEFRAVHPDGSIHFIKAAAVVQRNDQGKPQRMVGINYDITERKTIELALQESERRYAALTQASPVAIFQLDTAGNCIYVNDFWSDMTGRSVEAALGMGWLEALHPEDCDRILANALSWSQIAKSGELFSDEGRHLLLDGSISWFQSYIVAEKDANGKIISYIGTLTDITERKQAEELLQQTNEHLANTNIKLARATRLKDEFLANMSHELRTPLNAILGMSESLQDDVFGEINERQTRAIATIERSGKHLLALINDILDLSKIESGNLELELRDVSVNSLCDSSLIFIRQMALKKNISLQSHIANNLGMVQIDERRMCQVLINLLTNAVKFTPEKGAVSLQVSLEAPEEEYVAQVNSALSPPFLCFSIVDTGIGIAEQDISKLFQTFSQINSSLNRQYEGTGLGLALVKRIVELHGGTVTVISEVGKGSCFTVRIPYRTSNLAVKLPVNTISSNDCLPAQIDKSSSSVKSPRILLAEDNQVNIYTILNYLEGRGYALILANNGKQAIDLVKTQSPDLIIMDIQMPEVDGLEAIRCIRDDLQLVDIPIIALTALAMPIDKEICLAAGANEYLTKPIQLKKLVATIEKLLSIDN